ncbi:hypothetical protein L7F22_018078 [Adiantum nelumboides]|nr:hypothetical protein [Adiantum nelumboides]
MHGYSTTSSDGSWKSTKGALQIVKVTKKGTLYYLHCKALPGKFVAVAEIDSHLELWHKRLGHMGQKGLGVLSSLKRIDVKGSKLDFCNDCQYEKQVGNSYYFGVSCKADRLDLVHCDACSMPV